MARVVAMAMVMPMFTVKVMVMIMVTDIWSRPCRDFAYDYAGSYT